MDVLLLQWLSCVACAFWGRREGRDITGLIVSWFFILICDLRKIIIIQAQWHSWIRNGFFVLFHKDCNVASESLCPLSLVSHLHTSPLTNTVNLSRFWEPQSYHQFVGWALIETHAEKRLKERLNVFRCLTLWPYFTGTEEFFFLNVLLFG